MTAHPVPDLMLVAVTPDDEAVRGRLPAIIGELALGGVTAVMFREKSLDDPSFLALAGTCRIACRERGVAFILNERLGLCERLRPDCLHLTFRSPDPAAARARLPDGVRLGASVHSPGEAAARAAEGVDYLVYGPVFPTPSKKGRIEPRGMAELGDAAAAVPVPVVAIGGLDAARASAARSAGAAGAAAMSALFGSDDPRAAAAVFREQMAGVGS